MKNSAGPLDLQGGLMGVPSSILSDLGSQFRGQTTSFVDTTRNLDGILLIHSFNLIIGTNFGGFIVFQGTSRT